MANTAITPSTSESSNIIYDGNTTVKDKLDSLSTDVSSKVSNTGGTISGDVTIQTTTNTPLNITSNQSSTYVTIGNSASTGDIKLFNNVAGKYMNLLPLALTANRAIGIPDKDGTFALTSDIPELHSIVASSSSIGSVTVTHGGSSSRWQMLAYGNGNGSPWCMSIVYMNTYVQCTCSSNYYPRGVRFIDSTHFAIVTGKWDQVTIVTDKSDVSVATSTSTYTVDDNASFYPRASGANNIHFYGTLGANVLTIAQDLENDSITFYSNSNKPTNCPTNCEWGSYIFFKADNRCSIFYADAAHFACTYGIVSTTTSITWYII